MTTITSYEDYLREYKKSIDNPEQFWGEQAENFVWKKKWTSILNWDFEKPEIKWFEGGKLNITDNCLDKHLDILAEKTAIKWIANDTQDVSEWLVCWWSSGDLSSSDDFSKLSCEV